MHEFYLCELCETISGHINLYRTISVPHNNHTSSTTPTSSHMYVQDVHSKLEMSHFNQGSSTPQIVVLVMGSLHSFQSMASLQTAKETRLEDTVTQSTNTMRYNKHNGPERV